MLLNRLKKIFRIISFLEGVSYLLLVFVAVPIKYILGDQSYVKLLGMPHGILFVFYISIAFLMRLSVNWTNRIFLIILIASLIPFGTFYIDRQYLRK